ncbi:MAG: hypothetical protein B2I17_03635 [Thermoplasmatales archaeon B_DKE]|nr:MAG: hypothetical protein B2I17_03635 [Thermoplasmatales archaeon B_DKE]
MSHNPRTTDTALLVIDMQNDFVNEGGYFAEAGQNLKVVRETIPHIKKALDYFRENEMLVIFTQTMHFKYTNSENWLNRRLGSSSALKICVPGTWGAEIIKELEPIEGEPIIIKHRYDSFLNTDLDLILRSGGIRNLVIAGTQTNLCVDSTARSACMRDYTTILLEDGVSSPEKDYQEAFLKNFHENFGYVMNLDKLKSMMTDQVKAE